MKAQEHTSPHMAQGWDQPVCGPRRVGGKEAAPVTAPQRRMPSGVGEGFAKVGGVRLPSSRLLSKWLMESYKHGHDLDVMFASCCAELILLAYTYLDHLSECF